MASEVIDVDAPCHIDLTEETWIDLTLDEAGTPPPTVTTGPPSQKHRRPEDTRVIQRPSKRRKTGAGRTVDLTRVIELNDNNDEELKPKTCDSKDDSSSDEDLQYDHIHAGYDLKNSSIWNPIKVNESRLKFQVQDTFKSSQGIDVPISSTKHRHPDISDEYRTEQHNARPTSVRMPHPVDPTQCWPFHRQLTSNRRIPGRLPPQLLLPVKRIVHHTPVKPFHPITSFKSAPGSINRIVQHGSCISICSAATGGQPDEPDETFNHYNREGAVMVWSGGKSKSLSGHFHQRGQHSKQYGVNDIKFDLSGRVLVTTGNDKCLESWKCDFETGTFTRWLSWKYNNVPHDLAFKPEGQALAVAERKLYVYSSILDEEATEMIFPITGNRKKHSIGPLAWGRGETATCVYASSEPDDDLDFSGFHKAFDVQEGRIAYEFDEGGAGDAMTISGDGARLALLTRWPNRSHFLRMYDIRRHNPKSVLSTQLSPFSGNITGEVNSAAFSPDGIYLALARNDNHSHVYDSRMINRVLFDYEHFGPSKTSPGSGGFGVLQVEWLDGSSRNLPMGLVTGGSDGCVRLWDPFRSSQSSRNGVILAECSSDIACFSLGNCFKGERGLVVGDCAGEVSIFDTPGSNHL